MPGGMPSIRILLDQNAPFGLRRLLTCHAVATAAGLGWSTTHNGDLIRAAEAPGFAVLITCDQNIRYQQNLAGRQLALIELAANRWAPSANILPTCWQLSKPQRLAAIRPSASLSRLGGDDRIPASNVDAIPTPRHRETRCSTQRRAACPIWSARPCTTTTPRTKWPASPQQSPRWPDGRREAGVVGL
jgi:hypothetical protein